MKFVILPIIFSAALYAVLSESESSKGKRLHDEICQEGKESIPGELTCDEERGLDCVQDKCTCVSTMYFWDVGPMEWVPQEQKCLGSTGFICNFEELNPFNSSRDDQKCASGYCDRIPSQTEVCNTVYCAEKAIHQCGLPEFIYKPRIHLYFPFTIDDLKEMIIYGLIYLFFSIGGVLALHLRANTILR